MMILHTVTTKNCKNFALQKKEFYNFLELNLLENKAQIRSDSESIDINYIPKQFPSLQRKMFLAVNRE